METANVSENATQMDNLDLERAIAEIERLMVGQRTVIRHTLAACFAGGHVLFEDVPGTGKTTLASAIATVLGLKFSRIQGTPDLLPSELVGTMVFHPGSGDFRFRQGPVFTQLLLVDEINRATPRTQSALLEAMAEKHVTVDGTVHALEEPFFVMATANPIESQGVFPLPEAQLDRFLVRLRLGYIPEEEELEMLRRIRLGEEVTLHNQLDATRVEQLKKRVKNIRVTEDVMKYIVRLCRETRGHSEIELGASPRSVLSLAAFSQALALLDGRSFVTPDDVQEAWLPVMDHRIKTVNRWRKADTVEEASPLQQILTTVSVPTEFAGA